MTTTSLVDVTTKTTKDSSSGDTEVNHSVKKEKKNEVIQQKETTLPTSSLSSTTLPKQNKTDASNKELVEQGELVSKRDSNGNQIDLENTTTKPLTTAKLVDKKTDLANDSSKIVDENDISKETENFNETVEKTSLANTVSSYSQAKTTTNFNKEVVEQKDSENKFVSEANTSDLKNTIEKSLTTTELADTNEGLSKNGSSNDIKIVDSQRIDKLNNIAQETDESTIPEKPSFNAKASSYNKDLSGVKDNIKSFSNSIRDDDDEDELSNESVENRVSKKKEKIEEIVLLGKIEKNAPLKTGTLDVSAMTIKGNGNYVETERASKTHAIRINFKMFNNENVTPGNKEVFIVIQNPKGEVINKKGKFTVRSGKEMFYSDETMAYYDGHNINISILSGKFIQKIVKGTYIVKVYIERYLTGQTLLILS